MLGEWSRPTPGNNTPSGGGGSTTVKVTSITLNKTYASLLIGNTETLTVEAVAPDDATDKSFTWSSEDPAIATVVDGVVTAVSIGTVIIKATAKDGSGVEGKCTVYVGLLSGKFTINASGDQIQFAKGNLQYQASTKTWRFAENQYDYIGNAAGNTTAPSRDTQSDWIDLFGWGTSGHSFASGYGADYQPWSNTDPGAYGPTDGTSGLTGTYAQGDWGTNIGTGWRTLTMDEWKWLIGPSSPTPGTNCRTSSTVNGTANARYCRGKVNGKKGLVLFPDSYTHPDGVNAPVFPNSPDYDFDGNPWSSDDWTKMEAAGAVFLPAAGYRWGASVVANDGTFGYYWSSSPYDASHSYNVKFGGSVVDPAENLTRNSGCSVRLVCDAK